MQIQAEDKEHVLKALGAAGTAIRGKLGEPHTSIEKVSRPLEQVTTSSLEALQSYTEGHSEIEQGNFLASVPLFQRAIAIDPKFAMAHHFLSIAFENAGEGDMWHTRPRARECEKQAFALIDRVSDFERSYIAARYYAQTDEVDKAIDAYQLAIRNYPRFWGFHNYLSMAYIDTGRYEEGLKEALEAVRLQPNIEHPYRRQLDSYICLDNLSEAKRLAQKLRTKGLDGPRIHQRFLQMAYVEDDSAAIAKETQWFAGKPEEYISFAIQAANRDVHGQRRESRKLYQRAAETALREGLQDDKSYFEEADAQADALAGNCRTARRVGNPALALALCGDASGAEKFAAQASKLFPNGTVWNAVRLPEIQAAIALCRDQPARSVELLSSAAPYERSYLDAVYVRGLAYLRMHKGAEAVAEFEKIVDHKGANWYARIHPAAQFYSLSYLGMARGFALSGATSKAKKAFQDFFELWKDADPDLPILRQARAEYVKLQQETVKVESIRSAILSIAQQANPGSAKSSQSRRSGLL